MLLNADATKEAVLKHADTANIIHLASHGTQDGIYLSGRTCEEGKLTMAEVQSLSLNQTKMVVLSACDTFKGDLLADGVVGITRSFLVAGASTVIASMWPVSDEGTMHMMKHLYKELFDDDEKEGAVDENEMDVCSALQRVIVRMLKDDGRYSVSDWAPFLVYGLNTRSS